MARTDADAGAGCDIRVSAYKDGKTFDQCRQAARALLPDIKGEIAKSGSISWEDALAVSGYDAVVYKLVMKYMLQDGYDIGDNGKPRMRAGAG